MRKIQSNLFWYKYVSSALTRHSECLSVFCTAILYHIDDLSETIEKAFNDTLVKESLYKLTLSVNSMMPHATKQDVANSIRLVLSDLIDNYSVFESILIKRIPDITQEEVLCSDIVSNYSIIDDDEPIDVVRYELNSLKKQLSMKDIK